MGEEKFNFSIRANVHVRAAQFADCTSNFHIRAVRHAQTVRVEPRDMVIDITHVDFDITRGDFITAAAKCADCDFVDIIFLPFSEIITVF